MGALSLTAGRGSRPSLSREVTSFSGAVPVRVGSPRHAASSRPLAAGGGKRQSQKDTDPLQ